jgi:hypothetical protein
MRTITAYACVAVPNPSLHRLLPWRPGLFATLVTSAVLVFGPHAACAAVAEPWKVIHTQILSASHLLEYLDINPPVVAATYRASKL